jgi:hypothetical protein
LPGKDEPAKVPCATLLWPSVGLFTPPQCPALTKPPATAKPTEQSVLPLITYWSPPRMSYIGFGASTASTTVTVPAPLFAAKVRAAAALPGAAVTTMRLAATSTYQPRTVVFLTLAAFASSLRRAVVRSALLRLTTLGVAPAVRMIAVAPGSVTATVSRVPPAGIQAPAKAAPSLVRSRFSTTGAAASVARRAAIWSSVSRRSRRSAATIPGAMSNLEAAAGAAGAGGSAAKLAVGSTPRAVSAAVATPSVRTARYMGILPLNGGVSGEGERSLIGVCRLSNDLSRNFNDRCPSMSLRRSRALGRRTC